MEATVDYYATLEVDPDADGAAIRLAYRKLMRSHHPDVNTDDDAGAAAKAINEAYACLRDPHRRAAYDGRRRSPRAATYTPSYAPPPPFQPVWHSKLHDVAHEGPPITRPWKAASLGLAGIVTVVSFAITSAVDPAPAPPPEVVLTVDPHAKPCDAAGSAPNVDASDSAHLVSCRRNAAISR